MASVNKAILVGNLGSDPRVQSFPDGSMKVALSIATTDIYTDRQGVRQEDTQWHRIRLTGKQAKTAAEYLKKGDSVYIEGSIGYRKWTGDDQIERTVCEIFADEMRMLGSGKGSKSAAPSAPAVAPESPAAAAPAPAPADLDDDIPF